MLLKGTGRSGSQALRRLGPGAQSPGLIIAALFALALISAGLGAYAFGLQTSPAAYDAEVRSSGVPGPEDASTLSQYVAYPDHAAAECYTARNHDAADLCAQWRAAIAAEKAAKATEASTKWAKIATILSGLATAALLITIVQSGLALRRATTANMLLMKENARNTRRSIAAANETADALKEARRNADETARLVITSARNAERQLRAYLDFDGLDIKAIKPAAGGEICAALCCQIKNYGHTPAEHVHVSNLIGINDGGEINWSHEVDLADFASIAPQDYATKRMILMFPEQTWEELNTERTRIVVKTVVNYSDVFGQPHTLSRRRGQRVSTV
ncbi:hypothetical protein TPR58_14455 [Sphingomonas sp. HF-S3]|uniref:Uncharacterized protein n=1 Tax=Sphingomonas rustica TaxID=3103142 RepID=A0ABV0B9Y0_9SPHN